MMRKLISCTGALAVVGTFAVTVYGSNGDYVPDWTFKGSTLTGWHTVGAATWKATNGEIVGTPTSPDGGWLMLDKSFQDIQFSGQFQCTGGCKTGIMVRAEKTPAGMKGVYVSLTDGDVTSYTVTLDANGKELTRERLRAGGGQMRQAPSAEAAAAAAAARGAGAGRAAGAGGRGAAPGAGRAPGVLASGAVLPLVRTGVAVKPNEWNDVEVVIDANIFRPFINGGPLGTGAADEAAGAFGPVAIYVGGTGEVRLKDLAYKDISLKSFPAERVSSNFRKQQLSEYSYAWSITYADVNKDGIQDVIAAPFYYLGPNYTTAREIFLAATVSPASQYPATMTAFAGDFTGDGWPDVFTGFPGTGTLYVNPKGEPRRWDKYTVLPTISTEVSVMKDLNGDGKPEYIYGSAGAMWYASPDPANPTGTWIAHQVSETGTAVAHGVGAGDINGDGKLDIIAPMGWWEQPASGLGGSAQWAYHPQPFGRYSGKADVGGAEIAVYDVNGDKLNDVVTSLQAHGWGLAWYEQKRDAAGKISFVQHMIMDDLNAKNAGGVAFSEPHGTTSADLSGDGIPDFIVGKRYWAHEESYTDPDPMGAPVLYWYKTVRNPKAPGGAEFVPELIHNRSGAGSQLVTADLNKDGAPDVLTATNRGTFIFWGKPKAAAPAAATK